MNLTLPLTFYPLSRNPRPQVRRSIPHILIGGVPFWRRMEVQDCVAYLRLAVGLRDDVALVSGGASSCWRGGLGSCWRPVGGLAGCLPTRPRLPTVP